MHRRFRVLQWVCVVPLLLVACGDDGSSSGDTAGMSPGATDPGNAGDGTTSGNAAASDNPSNNPLDPGAADGERQLGAVGLQLYTVRAAMQQDFEGTLRSIAAMGYSEVEFAGLFGHDPAQVAALLGELNLTAVGSHVTYDRFRADPDAAIEETVALGAEYLVFPWLPDAERRTLEQWQGWVDLLNQVGQASQARGLQLAYHNHDFEFAAIDGVRPIDLLLDGLDPDLVKLELDLYWIAKAGGEPGEIFERDPGNVPLVHAKDMRQSDQAMMDVGQGDLDFGAVFAQAARAGIQHVIVEHDEPADPLQSVQNSLTYLKALSF